jgi:hypothetical protein
MPYDNHIRLTMSGAFQTVGQPILERFSFGINLSDPPNFDPLLLAPDLAQDCVNMFSRAGTGIANTALLQEVKMARIGADGRYTGDPAIVSTNARGGGGSQIKYPTQISLAVSFGTTRRGASGRGRMYLPLPLASLDTNTFTISLLAAEGVRDSIATWIADLRNQPGLDPPNAPRPTIASIKGYNTDITTVRVGRVLDTIRSRRTSVPESYTATVPV